MTKPRTDEGLFRAISQFVHQKSSAPANQPATAAIEVPVLREASKQLGLAIATDPATQVELYKLTHDDIRAWGALCSDPTVGVEVAGQVTDAWRGIIDYITTARRDVIQAGTLFPTIKRTRDVDASTMFGMMADKLAATPCCNARELVKLANDVEALSDPRFGAELGRQGDFESKVAYLAGLAAHIDSISDATRKAGLDELIERLQMLALDEEHGESRMRAVLDNATDDPHDRLDALEHEWEQGIVRGPFEEAEDPEREDEERGEHPH